MTSKSHEVTPPQFSVPINSKSHVVLEATVMSEEAKRKYDAIIPLEGSFEERMSLFGALLDEGGKPGRTRLTTPAGLVFISKEYGADVVQAVIDSGRLTI